LKRKFFYFKSCIINDDSQCSIRGDIEKSQCKFTVHQSHYLQLIFDRQSKRQSMPRKYKIPTPQTLQCEFLSSYLLLTQPEKSFLLFLYNILRGLSLPSGSLWSQWKFPALQWWHI